MNHSSFGPSSRYSAPKEYILDELLKLKSDQKKQAILLVEAFVKNQLPANDTYRKTYTLSAAEEEKLAQRIMAVIDTHRTDKQNLSSMMNNLYQNCTNKEFDRLLQQSWLRRNFFSVLLVAGGAVASVACTFAPMLITASMSYLFVAALLLIGPFVLGPLSFVVSVSTAENINKEESILMEYARTLQPKQNKVLSLGEQNIRQLDKAFGERIQNLSTALFKSEDNKVLDKQPVQSQAISASPIKTKPTLQTSHTMFYEMGYKSSKNSTVTPSAPPLEDEYNVVIPSAPPMEVDRHELPSDDHDLQSEVDNSLTKKI